MQTLRLAIRAMLAARVYALGPLEAEPVQVVDHAALGLAGRALEVGILDAQDERPALSARQQPVEERGARVAHMQLPGGARSKTESHLRSQAKVKSQVLGAGKQRDGVGCNRLACPHRIDTLVRLPFNTDPGRLAPERHGN